MLALSMIAPRFLPAGDAALVVEFGTTIDRAISDRVLALSSTVRAAAKGVVETVPTFRSLLVQYDPLQTSAHDLEATIRPMLDAKPVAPKDARRWFLPACYDGDLAPDLAEVAERTKRSKDNVIRLHSQTSFHVYVVGFAPGYAYLGDLPAELELPRRTDPRVKVPTGSVAIAQRLTGVYPQESPGGWHLIANCPVKFFDLDRVKPALLSPGDEVLFEPVTRAAYDEIKVATSRGAYEVRSETRG